MDERKKPRAPRRPPHPEPAAAQLSVEERAALQQMIAEVRAERLRLRQALARG